MRFTNLLHHLNHRSTRITPKFNRISKFIFILFAIVFTTQLVKTIFAQDNIIKYTQEAQKSGNNAESWQQNAWNTTSINALTTLTGEIPFNEDGTIKVESFVPSGVIGTANNMIASLYNPQASGIEYIAQVKDNFLGKPVYAQGIGFNGLQPLLPIWRGFRNVVYVLASVVFIVLGIMIMLRVKMNPQTIVTVQSAIPGLITALILVTFSYAIAGLLIDVSYLFQSIAVALIFQMKGVPFDKNLLEARWGAPLPVGDIYNYFAKPFTFAKLSNPSFDLVNLLASHAVPIGSLFTLSEVVGKIAIGTLVGGIGQIFGSGGNLIGQAIGGSIGSLIGGTIGGIIFTVILLIMVVVWLIKLFFGLLKAYLSILFKIIFAPIEIGMGAFPNSRINFSHWLISLIANLAIFPTVLIFLIIINYITEIAGSTQLWHPGMLDTLSIVDTSLNTSMIKAAIGLAGLAMLSKLPELVPQAIFQLKPSAFSSAIGEGLGGITKNSVVGLGKSIVTEKITNKYAPKITRVIHANEKPVEQKTGSA